MFDNFTYKQKIIGLVLVSVILFMAARKRSYKIAINTYKQVKEVEEKLKYIKNSNTSIQELKNEISYYDLMIGAEYKSPEDIQQGILGFSNSFKDIQVIGIEEIHKAPSNDFNIITNRLIVEGYYNELLHLIYAFEKEFSDASIINVKFTKHKEYNRKSNKIKTVITFQNYEKDKR